MTSAKNLNTKSKAQMLYGIRSGIYIKIGVSNNVIKRLEAIETCNPLKCFVCFTAIHDKYSAQDMEKFLHDKLKSKGRHKKLEWFRFVGDELEIILNEFKNADYFDNGNGNDNLINEIEEIEALSLVSSSFLKGVKND